MVWTLGQGFSDVSFHCHSMGCFIILHPWCIHSWTFSQPKQVFIFIVSIYLLRTIETYSFTKEECCSNALSCRKTVPKSAVLLQILEQTPTSSLIKNKHYLILYKEPDDQGWEPRAYSLFLYCFTCVETHFVYPVHMYHWKQVFIGFLDDSIIIGCL